MIISTCWGTRKVNKTWRLLNDLHENMLSQKLYLQTLCESFRCFHAAQIKVIWTRWFLLREIRQQKHASVYRCLHSVSKHSMGPYWNSHDASCQGLPCLGWMPAFDGLSVGLQVVNTLRKKSRWLCGWAPEMRDALILYKSYMFRRNSPNKRFLPALRFFISKRKNCCLEEIEGDWT